jgi:hypothetical protein
MEPPGPVGAAPSTMPSATVPGAPSRLGRVQITPGRVLVLLAFLLALGYCAWVTVLVRDDQIPLLTYGVLALGVVFAVIAIRSLLAMWQAASWARAGRALAMAIVGGVAGLAAIGSFAAAAVLFMLSNS